MYDISMRLLNANLTFVHPVLEEHVSKTANGIRIAKEAEIAQDCSLMINAVYYGENRHQVEESGHWNSRPTLKLQGDLLGICGEFSDWHRVKCSLVTEQAVHINDWDIAVGPWEKELMLLDTYPALARRDYPPSTWQAPLETLVKADGMIYPLITPLDAWIVVGVKITMEVKIKGQYSFLYVSSRCDSPEFALNLPDAYLLEWEHSEI